MSIKVLMVDVDGVVVRRPDGRRWDLDIERDLGVAQADLQTHFFARHWPDLETGRADTRDRLAAALPAFAPHLTAQDVMDYWFAKDASLNEALLADLAALRASGVPLHLATAQEHYRAAHLWGALDFKSRFDAMHYCAALGLKKSDPAFYAQVTARAGVPAGDIGYIDDSASCVELGRAAGWRAHVWRPDSTLAEALAEIG